MLQKIIARQLAHPKGFIGKLFTAPWLNKANMQVNQKALHYVPVAAGDRVLEIGFGGGDLLKQLLKKHDPSFVGGVDISHDMVRLVSHKLRAYIRSRKLQLCYGNIENLPSSSSNFDTLYTINTLYFWNDPKLALSECHRVLKPGGWIVLCFDAKEDLKLWPGHRYRFRLFEPEEVEILLRDAGFKAIEIALESNGELGRFYCMMAKKNEEMHIQSFFNL